MEPIPGLLRFVLSHIKAKPGISMENEAMQELQAEVAALRIMTATLLVASANRAALREAMRKLGATEIRRQETEGADTRMTEKLQSFLDEILDQLG